MIPNITVRANASVLANLLFLASLATIAVCVGGWTGVWWLTGIILGASGVVVAYAATTNVPAAGGEQAEGADPRVRAVPAA